MMFLVAINEVEAEGYTRCPGDHLPDMDRFEYVEIGWLLYYRERK